MRKRKPKKRVIAQDPRYGDTLVTQFVNNMMPAVEVRSKRIGGATFQIPTEIRPARRLSIGMKWLIRFSRARSGKGMAEKLSAEIIAASKGEGAAVKRREDTHRMAEANRAFAHFKA